MHYLPEFMHRGPVTLCWLGPTVMAQSDYDDDDDDDDDDKRKKMDMQTLIARPILIGRSADWGLMTLIQLNRIDLPRLFV